MKKLEKTISNKIKIGTYSLGEILVPMLGLATVVLVNWGKHVGDLEWVVRGVILIFTFEFWKIMNKLKSKRVRSYKAHFLIKLGLRKLKKFPQSKQFIG